MSNITTVKISECSKSKAKDSLSKLMDDIGVNIYEVISFRKLDGEWEFKVKIVEQQESLFD